MYMRIANRRRSARLVAGVFYDQLILTDRTTRVGRRTKIDRKNTLSVCECVYRADECHQIALRYIALSMSRSRQYAILLNHIYGDFAVRCTCAVMFLRSIFVSTA